MSDDHARACDRLVADLAALGDDDDLRLDGSNVPRPPAVLSMDRVIARRGEHQYGMPRGAWRVDMVSLSAEPADLGRLALVILGDLLHPSPDGIRVELRHPRSDIALLCIRSDDNLATDPVGQLERAVTAMRYRPDQPARVPWHPGDRADHLPHFALVGREAPLLHDRDWKARDVLVGCGGHTGSARFAALLLDLGRPGQPCDEIQLESAPGNGALAPASVELRLWLPGSVGFEPAEE